MTFVACTSDSTKNECQCVYEENIQKSTRAKIRKENGKTVRKWKEESGKKGERELKKCVYETDEVHVKPK